MTATYVTVAELRTNLGIGTLYSDPIVEEVCQTAQDLCNSYLWFDSSPVVAASVLSNKAMLVLANTPMWVIGQTVTVSGSGAAYNGEHTISGVMPVASVNWTYPWSNYTFNWINLGYSFIQFPLTHANDTLHLVIPYGRVLGVDTKTNAYASTPAVREAAMMLAVDCWQARQVSQTGGVSVDGFTPNPYRMGNNLMSKVRGLLSPYLSPAAMVG